MSRHSGKVVKDTSHHIGTTKTSKVDVFTDTELTTERTVEAINENRLSSRRRHAEYEVFFRGQLDKRLPPDYDKVEDRLIP